MPGMGKLCASATVTSVCLADSWPRNVGVDVILAGACGLTGLLPAGRHGSMSRGCDQTECLDSHRFSFSLHSSASAKTTGWEEKSLGVPSVSPIHGARSGRVISHWLGVVERRPLSPDPSAACVASWNAHQAS